MRSHTVSSSWFSRLRVLRRFGDWPWRRSDIPYLPQVTTADCGAACIAMVCAYYGKEVRLEEVRDVLGVGRDGSNAQGLLRTAEHFGLHGRGVRVDDLRQLEYLERGSILHWRFRHFVVFDHLDGDDAIIVDPAMGRRRAHKKELTTAFTGVALVFQKSGEFQPGKRDSQGVRRYLRYILVRTGTLSGLITLSLFLQVLALGVPVLTGIVVDRVVPRGDYQLLTVLSVGLGTLVVFRFLASYLRAQLLLNLRTQLDASITIDFLAHLVRLPYRFFQIRSSGDLIMRLNSNSTVREMLTSSVLSAVFDGVLVALYLIVLLLGDLVLGVLASVLGLLRVALYLSLRRRHRERMSEALHLQAASRTFQVQILTGIETLKTMGAEQRAVSHWSNLFADELNASIARGRIRAVFESGLAALASASSFAILVIGALRVLDGHLSLGTMLALSALAAGFLEPLSTLVSNAMQLQLMGSYLERIDDVFETPREQQGDIVQASPTLRGGIALECVSFRYSANAPLAVSDVSVTIEPGNFVALVGPSGAGKTTLANLIVGLYEPSVGRVLYDGCDLRQLDYSSLRQQFGVVNQQAHFFGSTVRDNIAIANPTLSMGKITKAARQAQIHKEIAVMPMGYDTVLGDNAASLSGGQRQRLALARALADEPKILILDEATSNLDTATERRIQETLSSLSCTRIVIAHRLSTVRDADLILVMHGGRILERGVHNELIGTTGLYSELVQAQALH